MAATFFPLFAVPSLSSPATSSPPTNYAPVGEPWARSAERTQVRTFGRQLPWIVLACAVSSLTNSPKPWREPIDYLISFGYTFGYCAGLWFANGYVSDSLNKYVRWGDRPMRRLLLTLAASLGASLLVILLVSEGFSMVLFRHSPSYIFQHNLTGMLVFPLLMTAVISLFMHSRSFLLAWREATVHAERLEKESAVARLDSLRRQVDPHFLFNSLNALTSLVEEENPARAVRFIRQLSQVYRYVLDSQSQELVPLSEELAFAESYIFLQKTRLDEALQVELSLPPAAELTAFYLPPLALQLLLENAVKHNTAFQTDPLRLHVSVDAQAQTITVRNTRRARRLSADETSGRGLDNLRARYGFLTNRPVQVGPVGDEFVVTLPLLAL
jgi:hypothetical protein